MKADKEITTVVNSPAPQSKSKGIHDKMMSDLIRYGSAKRKGDTVHYFDKVWTLRLDGFWRVL